MADQYRHINVQKMPGTVGVELSGFDVSKSLSDEVFEEIRRAFIDNYLIVVRDQNLTPETLCAFAARFGPLTKTPFLTPKNGHPYVVSLIREATTDKSIPVVGGRWHSDGAFMEETPLGSMLYAVEVPPEGGDTHFVSLQRAYDSLSPGMKKLAEQLFIMNYPTVFDKDREKEVPNIWKGNLTYEMNEGGPSTMTELAQPLVCYHPESGRKLLRLAGFYSVRFKDMTEEESAPLMKYFQSIIIQQDFVSTVKWTKGTVILWDNRAVQHRVDNNYPGYRREMWRVQIGGPKLVGPVNEKAPSHQDASQEAVALS